MSAIAVRDAAAPVSTSNPIGVVFAFDSSDVLAAQFTQITSLDPFTCEASRPLPGSTQIAIDGGEYVQRFVSLVAAPSGDEETQGGHWYVATIEPDPSRPGYNHSLIHVWEITATHPEGRELTVSNNTAAHSTSIAIASNGRAARLASQSAAGLATRSIGCH